MKLGRMILCVQRRGAAIALVALWQAGWGVLPAAADGPAPAPAPAPLSAPAMSGPLTANPAPFHFKAGPLGTIYASGVVTGMGLLQSDPILGDRSTQFDITNGLAIVQKTDGLIQFYAQAGIYSFPSVGYSYTRANQNTSNSFGALPVAYLTLAPNDHFSIQAGKLPTLIGAEYTFTFENMNIERGLLWGQEPAISRGVQANYSTGPFSFSASFNDGYYSDRFNWVSGFASYAINDSNTIAISGGGNLGRSTQGPVAPVAQNNSSIIDLIYTYSSGPLTVSPYFQANFVPRKRSLGIGHDAETYGGAVLASYQFTDRFSLAGRAEIIGSTGSATNGAPDLLGYGPGSMAWSLTATPTYQVGRFFVRAEGSVVNISDSAAGSGFGRSGTSKTQGRFVVETGFVF